MTDLSRTDLGGPNSELRPDWVIIGGPLGDGVQIYASTTLTKVELTMRANDDETIRSAFGPPFPFYSASRTIVAALTMDDFVLITAPTYAQAFHHLFAQWQPPGRQPYRAIAP